MVILKGGHEVKRKVMIGLLMAPVLVGLSTGMASASLTAPEILNQFNLVVFGDATSSSHVDGRAYVGGSLTGGIYVSHPGDTPASDYAGLTVGGGASGVMVNDDGAVIGGSLSNSTINSGAAAVFGSASYNNFNGPAYVAGAQVGNNFNGGTDSSLATGTAAQAATSTDFPSVLTELSNQLMNLSSTGSTVTINGNKATFNAVADSNGVAVFNLSDADLLAGEFDFNLNGATTIILNSGDDVISIGANFLGGLARLIGATTIWNFYNATSVTISSEFGGSILAPLADFTNYNNIEGGVYVNTLHQYGEIHLQPFTGEIPTSTVPVPPAVLLLGSALAGLAPLRKKFRAA